jgi:hypothetical protein
MFRLYYHHQVENILLSRTTQLTTDSLFYKISNITVIVCYILLLIVAEYGYILLYIVDMLLC